MMIFHSEVSLPEGNYHDRNMLKGDPTECDGHEIMREIKGGLKRGISVGHPTESHLHRAVLRPDLAFLEKWDAPKWSLQEGKNMINQVQHGKTTRFNLGIAIIAHFWTGILQPHW